MHKHLSRILIAAVLVGGALAAWQLGLFEYLTVAELQRIAGNLGPWAPLVFVLAFVLGELLQVPSVLWIVLAGLIWPWWLAIPLSLAAALLAATVAFLVARHILGDRFHEKLPSGFEKLNEGLKKAPLRAIVLIRLTTFLHPVVHWVLAASSIQIRIFLAGTALGILPGVVGLVLLGQTFMAWWDQYSVWLMVAAVLMVVIYAVIRKKSNRQKPTSSVTEQDSE